ncbi:hypothetical protein [Prescottella agglutinans]|uniref:Uncharacterized protein n=1 Tax=Prescottella agglutinans TaxID=1644129 RepID=A0ABT6MI33_9NOCA|nr:hypothetical protein [Prescottella agglutinans]MDH6283988.1 hypothetical protein [Prescottella agglutinans]
MLNHARIRSTAPASSSGIRDPRRDPRRDDVPSGPTRTDQLHRALFSDYKPPSGRRGDAPQV